MVGYAAQTLGRVVHRSVVIRNPNPGNHARNIRMMALCPAQVFSQSITPGGARLIPGIWRQCCVEYNKKQSGQHGFNGIVNDNCN